MFSLKKSFLVVLNQCLYSEPLLYRRVKHCDGHMMKTISNLRAGVSEKKRKKKNFPTIWE